MKYGEHSEEQKSVFSTLTSKVIGCAIEVHRTLGPGLLESAYEHCLAHELNLSGLKLRAQEWLPIHYKGVAIDCGYRFDIVVENCVVLELKSVDKVAAVHKAQLLTYMKLMEAPVGLLLNFNVSRLTEGISRFVI